MFLRDEYIKYAPAEYATQLEKFKQQRDLISFLQGLEVFPQLLADDRRLYTDDPELERLREVLTNREAEQRVSANDFIAYELRLTITRINEWLRSLALRGQNIGSAGANSIYQDVIQRLASTGRGPATSDSAPGEGPTVSSLLADLRVRSPRFERYDLVPHFDAAEFEGLMYRLRPEDIPLANDILLPYLNSLSARCDALEEAEQLVTSLLSATNDFLIDKHLEFSARKDGVRIVTDDGQDLDPIQLSSGERQLVMLVCTAILAGRDTRLLLIDEPELSLGVAWQRRVLESLLSLTKGSSLQFVVATHSIEIISSQLDYLVPLSR